MVTRRKAPSYLTDTAIWFINEDSGMVYNYQKEREGLFTEQGQRVFIGVRDQVKRMLKVSGAVRMQEAIQLPRGVGGASSWEMLACVDRLVELGELVEIPTTGAGQYRVFVEAY